MMTDIWEIWDGEDVSWRQSEPDGTVVQEGTLADMRAKPSLVAAMTVLQGLIAEHGISDGDIASVAVEEVVSRGMNAFVSDIRCEVAIADGRDETVSLTLSGPAVAQRRIPMARQIELTYPWARPGVSQAGTPTGIYGDASSRCPSTRFALSE